MSPRPLSKRLGTAGGLIAIANPTPRYEYQTQQYYVCGAAWRTNVAPVA